MAACANPKATPTIADETDLISDYARTLNRAKAGRLVNLWAAHGLAGFERNDHDSLRAHFDIFAPLLIESQRPGGRVSADVQALFSERASHVHISDMCAAIREWLTGAVPISSLGRIHTRFGKSLLRLQELEARVTAAQWLSDYGDREALPLVEALHDTLAAYALTEDRELLAREGFSRKIRKAAARLAAAKPRRLESAPPPFAIPSLPSFVAEWVRLEIAGDELELMGTYRFEAGAILEPFGIVFPFIEDAALGSPTLVSATIACDDCDAYPLEVATSTQSWAWTLPFDVARRCDVSIRYRQSVRGRRASYLLVSANTWGWPLRSARLEVVVPAEFGAVDCSWPIELESATDDRHCYAFDAAPFWPDRDLIVTW
jgi:hypothetical protein